MERIIAEKFINFIGRGATKPFVVEDDKFFKWVVKVLGNSFGAQTVFNEYIVGCLAGLIGLPWPRPSIVALSPSIMKELCSNGLNAMSHIAVGTEFLFGLIPVEFPEDFDLKDKTKNANYIRRLFPDSNMLDSFYGKSIFDNWVLLLNDTKYDTLHISPDGKPVFLDATFAFGFFDTDWDQGKLVWNRTAINIELSPYLNGIVGDPIKYKEWIDRITKISKDNIDTILDAVPKEWEVPDCYISAIRRFLLSTPDVFIPLFQAELDFLNYGGQLTFETDSSP